MSKLKTLLFTLPLLFTGISATSCNSDIDMGKLNFDYVLVNSPILGTNYYHISRWKEIDPEEGQFHYYRGLEFTTVISRIDYYFYEIDLTYIMMHGEDKTISAKYTPIE